MSAPIRTKVEPGVYRRPSGALEIVFKDAQGKTRRKAVKNGGILAARKMRSAEHARRDRGERLADDPRITFDAAASQWWAARVVRLRPATQVVYGAALKHLRQDFGHRRMTDITPTALAKYIAVKGATRKGATVTTHVSVLGAVFVYAQRHLGLVATNPVTLLERVERPNTADAKAHRVLTPDELGRLIASVDRPYQLLFELAAQTGARLSEALGLTWWDIDTEAETITITHQLSRDGGRVALKTKGSRRCLEVTPGLVAKLRAHKLASPRSTEHDLVFVSRAGTPLEQANVGGRVMRRAVNDAGLEAVKRDGQVIQPAPSFHTLRHSHASALIAQGWDIQEVASRLGHSDIATTMRTYAHRFDAARRSSERRDRLTALYGGEMATKMATPASTSGHHTEEAPSAEVVDLQANRAS